MIFYYRGAFPLKKRKKQIRRFAYIAVLFPLAVYRSIRKDKESIPVIALLAFLGGVIIVGLAASQWRSNQTDNISGEISIEDSVATETVATVTATPVRTEPVSITVSFAGDCTFGMDSSFSYEGSFNAMYDSNDPEYFLQNVQSIFAADDVTVVNFEGTLTDSEDRADKTWAFRGDAEYAKVLSAGSVEAVNLANNHSSDYGEESLADTKAALSAEGITYFGFEETAILEVKGIKIGFLGLYTVYTDDSYTSQLEARIQELQDEGAAVIIASFHWGYENSYTPEQDQIELAHAAIDAGADLVIGHHPHVLQGIEKYNGHYIAYSLGNFCFGGNYNPADYDCIIVQQTFTVTGADVDIEPLQVIPCSVSSSSSYNNYQPTPAEGSEKERIFEKLQAISADLGDGSSWTP